MSVFDTISFTSRTIFNYATLSKKLRNASGTSEIANIISDFLDDQILELVDCRRKNSDLSVQMAKMLYQNIIKQLEAGLTAEDLEFAKNEARIKYPEGTSCFEIVMDTPRLMAVVGEIPEFSRMLDSLKQLRSLCD